MREINKTPSVMAVCVLTLLPLLLLQALVVLPVCADTVTVTAKPKQTKWGWKTNFNVTNNGAITDGIYDFHVSITGAKILRVSKPASWGYSGTQSEIVWKTKNKPIWDGKWNAEFDIVTDLPTYTVWWWTTNKEGAVIDSGSFTVSP